MSFRNKHYDTMIFNYETTGRTDYRKGAIKPTIKTTYQEKTACSRIRPPPLKDLHALTDWKKPSVPFNLMHRPKEIVQTNPWKPQQPFPNPVDLLRKEVQMTRPRLVMTPAVSLDDIDDKTLNNLTTTLNNDATNATPTGPSNIPGEAAAAAGTSRVAHGDGCVGQPPAARTLRPHQSILATIHITQLSLPKIEPPRVPSEWRMDSAAWNSHQLRAYSDTTRHFWLGRTPKCDACNVTAEHEVKDKTMRRAKQHQY